MRVLYGLPPGPRSPKRQWKFPAEDESDEGSVAAIYGMAPPPPSEEEDMVEHENERERAAPEPLSAVRARLEDRKRWLQKELRMHKAWEEELRIIEQTLAGLDQAETKK